jgi:hypothetical protein
MRTHPSVLVSSAPRVAVPWIPLLGLLLNTGASTAAANLSFNRDIKPILSDNCYACHGPDPGSRKAGLRLDTREGLFESTPKRAASRHLRQTGGERTLETHRHCRPGRRHASAEVAKDTHRRRRRTCSSAGSPKAPPGRAHWSFVKPERPTHPPRSSSPEVTAPHPQSHRRLRFRTPRRRDSPRLPRPTGEHSSARLSLDLTGLPPSPAEVEAFVADTAPDAYDRAVRASAGLAALGRSTRGRYWLDAARYADTHGLHFDNYREMWPYRDWVIRAFNSQPSVRPFHRGADCRRSAPDPTDDQLIATGFHRCNATTNEGGTIEEENQVNYANDRVTTTSWVWLGLTANCASCHDHKFDPITMRDFYSLSAFFRNTTQSGFDGNLKDGANASMTVISNSRDRARWTRLPA